MRNHRDIKAEAAAGGSKAGAAGERWRWLFGPGWVEDRGRRWKNSTIAQKCLEARKR